MSADKTTFGQDTIGKDYWSFEEALDFLYGTRKFGIKPGLERIRQFMDLLGNPQNAYPVVHIAGTNGKGSISSMCAYTAAAGGKRVGLFTSPYLTHFNERIRVIDGRKGLEKIFLDPRSSEISDSDFAKIMALLAFEIEIIKAKGGESPTEFEILTAAAFVYFAEMKCDIVILETGLGGRLDSTNIAEKKIVTVISALSYDHMDKLGSTISEIAMEKAGIMRQDIPTILYNPHDTELSPEDAAAALNVIETRALELHSELTIVSRRDIEILSSFVSGQSFTYQNKGPYHIQLGGDYQSQNASLAIEACRYFSDQKTIEEALAMAKWPGRLECLSQKPFILIDGAHNYQGIVGLRKYLEKFMAGQKLIFLFGVLGDKAYPEMINHIVGSNIYKPGQIIATEPDFFRALPADQTALEFTKCLNRQAQKNKYSVNALGELESEQNPLYNDVVLYEHDLKKATAYAYQLAVRNNIPLIAFGSLYMIGDIRPELFHFMGEEIS